MTYEYSFVLNCREGEISRGGVDIFLDFHKVKGW